MVCHSTVNGTVDCQEERFSDSANTGSGQTKDDIVIVGMGMRLPGGIRTGEDLWSLLVEKRSTRGKVPPGRFNAAAFCGESPNPRLASSEYGHFLAEDDALGDFDTSFFRMSKIESEILDPQQRLLLEVVYECMQNGGQGQWRGENIGCFVGVWGDVSQSSAWDSLIGN